MRVKALSRALFRRLFRRGWLSAQVESDPLVVHLRTAVEESWKRQDRPFRLDAGTDQEHGVQYRLPQLLQSRYWLYVTCALLGVGVLVGLAYVCGLRPHDLQYFGVIPSFVASVVAIGLPLVSTLGALRRSGRWAEEYLFRTTHLGWFTFVAGLTAAVGFVSILAVPMDRLNTWAAVFSLALAGLAWGLTLATLLYLTAVVLEIVYCSRRPEFACAASANLLSERLLEGFLRNCYLAAFLRAHEDHLEKCCSNLKHLDVPHEYMEVQYRADVAGMEYQELTVPLSRFTIQAQFLDYDLSGLERLDEMVSAVGSRLCLTPHRWTQAPDGRGAHIGILLPQPARPLRVNSEWFRPRRDFCASWGRHSQEDLRNQFLHEVSMRLAQFDTRGYRLHLRAVGRAARKFAALWADPEVRRLPARVADAGDNKDHRVIAVEGVYGWIWLYGRLLNQILYHTPQVERTPQVETLSLVGCHQEAYRNLLDGCVSLGNAEMFGLLLRLLPHFYNAVDRFCKSEDKRPEAAEEAFGELREMRAKWGLVYELPSAFLEGLPPELDAPTRWRFLLFLHQFACVWIREAKQKRDDSLVVNLAEGIAMVMEKDLEWRKEGKGPPEADLLMARHWFMLGESLSEVLPQQAQTPADLPGKLTPKFLQEQEPEQLLEFYASHRWVDEFDRGFEDLLPDVRIPMRPLGGGGVGPTRCVPHHEEEMRLAFLWLLLFRPGPPEPLPGIPVDVAGPAMRTDLERIVRKFAHDPARHHIWRLPPEGQKHWIEGWLERCAAAKAAQEHAGIAEAKIDANRAATFQDEFQKSFQDSLVLTRFLVNVGAYELQEDLTPLRPRALVPKRAAIAPSLGSGDTLGDDFGRLYGHSLDIELVRVLMGVKTAERETKRDHREAIDRAAEWLKQRGRAGNEGIIAVLGGAHVGSLLLDNEEFVPAWKEADGIEGFEGRYKGLAVWEGQLGSKSKVLALDLRDSRPLIMQPRALSGSWADVSLRELTAEELWGIGEQRQHEGKQFDQLRERQNCVADISVYARFAPPETLQVLVVDVPQAQEQHS